MIKIELSEKDIKTLKENKKGWSYEINTQWGKLSGSEIKTKQEAIDHCKKHLIDIVKRMLKIN